jgi:hypothetical protein
MCWNIEVSMASAAVGWAACLFLLWRQRSARDTYYAKYLFTFTFTQIADAYLWTLNEKAGADAGMGGGMGGGLQACESYQLQFGSAPTGAIARPNFLVSKYVIPLIVFSQHAMQLSYPSEAFKGQRTKIIAAHAVPCLVMSFCFGCTMLTDSHFPRDDQTLFWGGDFSKFPFLLIQAGAVMHSGLVAFGFHYFCGMEGRVLWAHLIPLACVVSFLLITEGRMDFGSKWCSYCLIYSAVYVLEPLWLPHGAGVAKKHA